MKQVYTVWQGSLALFWREEYFIWKHQELYLWFVSKCHSFPAVQGLFNIAAQKKKTLSLSIPRRRWWCVWGDRKLFHLLKSPRGTAFLCICVWEVVLGMKKAVGLFFCWFGGNGWGMDNVCGKRLVSVSKHNNISFYHKHWMGPA